MPSGQRKTGVGDRKTHFEKTFLVSRFDRKHLVGIPRTVDVGVRNLAGKGVAANDLVGIGEQVFRVGLEIDPPCGFQQPGVVFEEQRRGETLLGPAAFELRIGKGDPDFVHLVFGEQAVDELHARAQEARIGDLPLGDALRAAPHAGALDVDADIVARRVVFGQRHGVFALAAAQLQYDGVVVVEKVAAPAPLEGMVAVEYLVEFGLYETVESQILAESAEFIFAHCLYWLFAIWMPTASTPSTGRQGVIVRNVLSILKFT